MNRNQDRPQYLRGAQSSWQKLEKEAFQFLNFKLVKLALRDDKYRKKDFQQTEYPRIAKELLLKANNTQKDISRRGERSGMIEMTVIQEWMNILLEGQTFHTSYEVLPLVIPGEIQSIRGLTIYGVLATSLESRVTQGPLGQDELPKDKAFYDFLRLGPAHKETDPLITISNGLSVLVAHKEQNINSRIPPWNQIGTREQIKNDYAWAKSAEKKFNLWQAALFRVKQLRERAIKELMKLLENNQWKCPPNTQMMTVMSEVCTMKKILEEKMRPSFGEKQWGIGPDRPHGQSICFADGNIEEQIQKSWDLIRTLVLDYPTDNPFPWERR